MLQEVATNTQREVSAAVLRANTHKGKFLFSLFISFWFYILCFKMIFMINHANKVIVMLAD